MALGAGLYFFRVDIRDFVSNWQKEDLPEAVGYRQASPMPAATPKTSLLPSLTPNSEFKILDSINLAVPFTPQAPYGNWDDPYAEFCEEASVLMAISYIMGSSIPNLDFADQNMLKIKSFEEARFGYYKDTTAEETAVILREYYKYEKVKVVYDPSVDIIKKSLSEKKVIIVPAAGRMLGNPYFTQPGPLYHMLVIKGYTKDGNFITNDPGTRRGADFIYAPNVLMNAIHDWNDGDVQNGRRVIIIVG